MDNKTVNIRWYFFEGIPSEDSFSLGEWIADSKISLYHLGSKQSPFCFIAEQPLSSIGLVENLQKRLKGSHVLIEFQASSSFTFYLVISPQWLSEQLQCDLIPADILSKVLSEWQENGRITQKHLAFQKKYAKYSYKLLLLQAYCYELLYHFVNDIELELGNGFFENFKTVELKKIKEIEITISQDFHIPTPSINEMANRAGMSVSKFKILFKEIYSMSPHQYVLEKKLEKAKELMASGEYTFTQIAYKLGYNHTSGFTRLYQKLLKGNT